MTKIKRLLITLGLSSSSLDSPQGIKHVRDTIRNKSGVYGFICRSTDKMYIGSSKSLSDRFNKHLDGSRSNIKLIRAAKKYSWSQFTFVVLEYCDIPDLIEREQHYIDVLEPEFNILLEAGNTLGYEHTPESKALMSGENHPSYNTPVSEETKAKISEAMKDRSLSDSHRANISESLKGKFTGEDNPFFGQKHTEETKKAMSQALSGENHYNYGKIAHNAKRIFIYSLENDLLGEFSSIYKAAEWLNTNRKAVRNSMNKTFKDKFFISNTKLKD